LHPQRDVSYSPVFQVLFAFQNTPWEKPSLPGLEVSPIALDSGTSKFDLSLIIKERDGTLQIVMEYSTDLFNAQTIERMLAHYETLLKGIISNPCQQLSKLPLLTDEERRQILVNWNNTESAYAENRSVYELFEEQVEEAPDAVAVLFENQSLTYRQLNARANQLAWHLQELGVRPDSLVGICVERSLEMIIGLLGILKAGGAYVPLDPEYPKDRLAFMLEDSSVTVLLTQDHLVGTLPASPARLIRLDTDWPAIASQISINVEHTATAKNLAYMIYTSGSTGRPKGVLVEHGPLTEHCLECRDFYGLTSKDRVLQFASLSFDAALEQILPPLLSGACVVLRPTLVWSPVEFQQRLIELRLTVINLPPAYWHEIAEAWSTSPKPMRGHQLRLVIIGGDAMLPQTLKLWQQTPFKEVRLLNAYGPTETIITATTFEVSSSREPLQRIPIGKKRGNRLCYMMDRWGQLVPIGVPGELHIGGAWLARGYHNRPELTAEKFIPNSFSADPKARLYKTGDLARFLPDGNIEYLGRLDHQVKIRGFRIELGEIEEVLNQYHGIRTSIVAAQEDVPGNKRLVGYIVSRNGPIDTAELREYLRGKLPDYMVPATFVTLDSLPLTPNGKVNRKALPKPEFEPQADKFVPPTTPTEIALAKIWCEVLGLKQVSIHDNFFDVGGHSLLAVRLINRINKSLSLDLSIPIFFHNTTIKGLATVLDRGNYSIREPKLIQLLPGSSARTIYLLDISIGLCRLAQHLEDTELAIFGTTVPLSRETFQSAAQNEMDKLPSLQDLAATHTALIKNHQSSGPCFLAGHSFGGLLAFEVAHQLQREGRQVEMIFLLDCWATSPPWWKKLKVLSLARAQESLKFRTSHLWSNTRTKITRMIRPSFSVSESGGMLALDLDEINRPIGDAPWEIWKRIYQNARKHYQLFSLESRAILFRAEHSDMAHLYPIHEDLGWGGLFGQGLQIMKVPGDHFTLLKEPEVLTLAQKFRECLGNLPAQVEGFPKASVPMKKENLPSVVPK
jgi:amino acid adenylation domain-containing protein